MKKDKVTENLSNKMELENVGNIQAQEVWNEETENISQEKLSEIMELENVGNNESSEIQNEETEIMSQAERKSHVQGKWLTDVQPIIDGMDVVIVSKTSDSEQQDKTEYMHMENNLDKVAEKKEILQMELEGIIQGRMWSNSISLTINKKRSTNISRGDSGNGSGKSGNSQSGNKSCGGDVVNDVAD